MSRRNLCNLLVLSLVISCAIAIDEKEKVSDSVKKDEKTVSKRGVLHYSTHGHVHPAIVSGTHYHLPPSVPAFAKYPVVHGPAAWHAPIPIAPRPAWPAPIPVAPRPVWPVAPTAPHYHITPGGASVTSYSVNYPRFPLPQPAVPFYHKPIVPAFAPPVLAPALPAAVPAYHHHAPAFVPHHHHAPAYVPHYHSTAVVPTYLAPRPQVVPVAVPYPGIRHPKYPVYFNPHKPIFTGTPPQYIPFANPTPTFIPVAVPSNPQPASPPAANHPGTAQDTNLNPATQEFPHIQMPTQPTFVHQPTQPTMTSHGWRPIDMMTQHHHHPQATQTTFTNKYPPYNYHAPAMAFNHDQTSSTNDIVSGHGQMSGQLAHQLALYQHLQHQRQHEHQQQQYVQQQQDNSYPYPAAAETFQQNYDQPSNSGQYQGLSSYQVPVHH